MILESQAVVRPVKEKDRTQLANLIHFGTYVHRHLDWRPPLGWIGHQPFNTIEKNNKLVAALACPPDPPKIAWTRVFVCNDNFSQTEAWEMLWPQTKNQLADLGVEILAAIPLQKWIRNLLINQGFEHAHNVISLAWDSTDNNLVLPRNVRIREMTRDDLPQVLEVDSRAFDPLWQNSSPLLDIAFDSAIFATVAVDSSGIIGYQISTPTQYGAHLGRLAVHPNHQRKGVGFALVRHLQYSFSKIQSGRISVNTQDSNIRSLSLYQKAGFSKTTEIFPVFQKTF